MKRNLLFVLIIVGAVCFCGCEENGIEDAAVVEAAAPVRVKLSTSLGDIVIELDEEKAPVTVKNFLQYVNDGFYEGLIFHRVMSNFMIQGGGFDSDLVQKATRESIVNEGSNGLSNDRGTIAMARRNDLNSATSQFYINHKDNPNLNEGGPYGAYAVFGKVVEGIDVVDAVAAVKTTTKTYADGSPRPNVPVDNVVIISAKVVASK